MTDTTAQDAARSSTDAPARLVIDVWADVLCPWCYIGERPLERAVQDSAHADRIDLRIHSFEINPAAPHTATSTVQVLSDAHGMSLAQARAMEEGMARKAAEANVAGIMDGFTPIHEVADAVWERVFRINVTGLVRLSRAVVARMLTTGGGAVVNVASEAGIRGSAAGVAYTASKHAVVGITRNSAVMYATHGVRTNAVAPARRSPTSRPRSTPTSPRHAWAR